MIAAGTTEGTGCVAPDPRGRREEGTPEPLPPPPPAMLQQQAKMSPRTPDRASPSQKGTCFACQQEGHWSRDCPSKIGAAGSDGAAVEAPDCYCGAGPCVLRISKTDKNPGRKFFTCRATQKCNFFQWCDTPSPYRLHDAASPIQRRTSLESPIQQQVGNTLQQGGLCPMCECGAGWCIVLTMEEGEDAGRKYFACPKKKNDEQCPFWRWCDGVNLAGKCMGSDIYQNLVSPPHGNSNLGYPDCSCGAGTCRIETTQVGEYAGRQYFACPVKKGQGACNFHRWLDNENGKNHVGGSSGNVNQHQDSGTKETVNAEPFNMEPTLLNFDDINVGVADAGSDKIHPLSHLERQQQGDGRGPPAQCHRLSLNNSSPDVSLKLGKCYRCGKEGHWRADCTESLPTY